ncbi:MAG: hypothetical protein NZ520_10165 [bacterium]|nr:hypothetical protein [bacterium]
MRCVRFLVVALGLLSFVVSSSAQQLPVRFLRSFDLSSIFDGGTGSCGDVAIDVAYDGTNAYVAGFRAASGVGPVGILRIDNVLARPSGALSYGVGVTKIFGRNAAGVSRDTRLVYHDGYLYAGFGLGHGSNPDTAIVRLTTAGLLDELWAGDGLLSLTEVGFSRYDSIALDPGFGGSAPALAVAPLSSPTQIIRRVSLATGAVIGTSNSVAPAFLRDIAFSSNGDLYVHRASADANDGIFKAVRTGENTFGTLNRIISFDAGNLQQCTVNYIPASQALPFLPDLLAHNFRPTATDPASFKLFVTDPDGNRLGEWDGSGVTIDGVQVARFGSNLLNVAYYLLPARVLVFVVNGSTGNADRLDILEIALTTTVSGTVTLGDFGGDVTTVPVVFEVRNPGETTPIETYVIRPNSAGGYEFTTSLQGTYDIAAKASHWLRQVIPNVTLAATPVTLNFTLINGDVDGDNEVSLLDFGRLVAAFGTAPGDEGWNPNADLDGDQDVNLLDFGVLVRNFGLSGDE